MEVTSLDQKTWLNVEELSEYIGLKKSTIYTYISRKVIPHYKRGHIVRFLRQEIDEWMMEGKVQTDTELITEQIQEN